MIKSSCAFVFAYFLWFDDKKNKQNYVLLAASQGRLAIAGCVAELRVPLFLSFSPFFFFPLLFLFFCFLPTPHFYSLHSLLFSYVVKTNAFLFLFLSFSGLFTSNMPEIRPIWTFLRIIFSAYWIWKIKKKDCRRERKTPPVLKNCFTIRVRHDTIRER